MGRWPLHACHVVPKDKRALRAISPEGIDVETLATGKNTFAQDNGGLQATKYQLMIRTDLSPLASQPIAAGRENDDTNGGREVDGRAIVGNV